MSSSDSCPSNGPPPVDRFVEQYCRCQRQVYAHIRTLVADADDADDIWQNTSLVLWRKFHEFRPGTSFLAWACQIARYEVMQARAKHARSKVEFSDRLLEELGVQSEQLLPQADARLAALEQCMGRLSEADRQIIQHRYRGNAPTIELAESLGRSPRSIYKAVTRIRRALLDCIDRSLAREGHR